MSGRIRIDEAGPGSSTPSPAENENRQREARDAPRTAPEPADEQNNLSATRVADEGEETRERSAHDDAGPSESEARAEPDQGGRDQKRIDQLTRERYEARRQRDEALAQLSQWQREQQRQQQPQGPEREAEERAYQRMQQERLQEDFDRDCNTLWQKGVDEFGDDMAQAKRGLDAVGWGNRPDALAALTALPDGHRIYRELATDLDNAARILSLPPMRMAVELARMSREDLVNAANVSRETNREPIPERQTRAPQPLRPIGGNSARQDRPLDQVSMAEFIRRRDREERGSRIRR